MKSRFLVTGASGLVGGALAKKLAFQNDVCCISRKSGCDINSWEELSSIEAGDFDTIIHCAASFMTDTIDGMINNEMVNSIGTLNMCKFAVERNCRHFVYISSISALCGEKSDDANSYGVSKKHGEDNIRLFCRKNKMKYTILRFSQIYDSQKKAEKHQPMLYRLIDLIVTDREVLIYGNNDPLRNYIYIDDVIEIIARTVALTPAGEYCCINPESKTILEIVQMIGRISSKKPCVRLDLDERNIGDIYIPSDLSLYDMIDFYPKISLEEGTRRIINTKYGKI